MNKQDHALLRRHAANEASRRIVDELFAHVRESVGAAAAGNYEARSWLCESFPGCTALFHRVWTDEPAPRSRRMQPVSGASEKV
jgi:hypothetical protein